MLIFNLNIKCISDIQSTFGFVRPAICRLTEHVCKPLFSFFWLLDSGHVTCLHGPLCLASFTSNSVLKLPPRRTSPSSYFSPFEDAIGLHIGLHNSSADGHWRCLHFGDIVNSSGRSWREGCVLCVCVNESTCLQFLCMESRRRITGSYSSSALSYMKTQYGFSLAVLHFPVVLGIGLACQAASLPEPHLFLIFLLRQGLNFLS